jgi:hypothetical protein
LDREIEVFVDLAQEGISDGTPYQIDRRGAPVSQGLAHHPHDRR